MAGFAIRRSCAGHASRNAKIRHALRLKPGTLSGQFSHTERLADGSALVQQTVNNTKNLGHDGQSIYSYLRMNGKTLMKKIIVHCGMPKTGSSALQVQLAQNHAQLLKHGYDYLRMGDFKQAKQGKITSGNGAALARTYLSPNHPASLASRRNELTEKFRQEIDKASNHVILSSEFFSAAPRSLLGKMVEALSDLGKVQLVFFVREQVNALASTYIQQVKRKMLDQFPDDYFANWDGSKFPLMAYHSYFNSLAKKVPENTLLVRPYELSKAHPAGLMGLFLEMIGVNILQEDLSPDTRVNLSPSPQEIRLMIEANKHHPRMQFSDMLVEGSHAAGRVTIHAQHAILPPTIIRQIIDFFKEENEQFFQHISKSENIYKKSWDKNNFIDLRKVEFDAASVIDILTGLMVNMDRRVGKLEKLSESEKSIFGNP